MRGKGKKLLYRYRNFFVEKPVGSKEIVYITYFDEVADGREETFVESEIYAGLSVLVLCYRLWLHWKKIVRWWNVTCAFMSLLHYYLPSLMWIPDKFWYEERSNDFLKWRFKIVIDRIKKENAQC